MNIGNIYFIPRGNETATEQRLGRKYLLLIDRLYRYRRRGDFTHSCGAGRAADIVRERLVALRNRKEAA